MLIYNHRKEFVGIDESDLVALGFKSLEELLATSSDFADMFVKKPGYVHNFQHVSWIDFVACADSIESTKVIIHAKSKDFRCLLEIETAYLMENKSSKAFLVHLTQLRELIDGEEHHIATHLPPKQVSTPTPAPTFEAPHKEDIKELEEMFEASIIPDAPVEINLHDHEESLEEALAIDLETDVEADDTFNEPDTQVEVSPQEELKTYMEVFDNGYIFDPHVASDELGLPVDLIEEFIEDFIAQAKEFKTPLYQALDEGDIENIKSLSHKLKGVAANLRIEDALEHLTIINNSRDLTEISTNLETFYKIISKLAGEKIPVSKTIQVNHANEELEELIAEEEIDIDHSIQDTEDDLDMFLHSETEDTITMEDNEIKIDMSDLAEEEDEDHLDIFTPQEISIEEDDEKEIEIDMSDAAEEDEDHLHIFAPQENSIQDDIPTDALTTVEKSLTYDPLAVAQEIGLSQEYFMELLQDYVEEAEQICETISRAIEQNNPAIWKTKAMQLKGMSDNMRILDFTSELEILVQTHDVSTAKEASVKVTNAIKTIAKIEE